MKRIAYALVAPLLLALTPGAAAQDVVVDTLVSVGAGTRVELHNMNGAVAVGTWDRSAVRVVARASQSVPIRVELRGSSLMVHVTDARHLMASVRYDVTVPRAADVEVHGQNSGVTMTDAGGRVEIHTVNGPVTVTGGRGRVEVHSVNGGVEVTGTRGDVSVSTVNQGSRVRDVVGDVSVNAVNGAVRMERIDGRRVEASNVQGEIHYVGAVRPDGVYKLSTHSGRLTMTLACDASARVTVSTFNGTLQSDCPVTLVEGPRARRFDITLGAGQAQIELTSFNGKIQLRRP